MQRRRFKNTVTFPDRLEHEAKRLREAEKLPQGSPERETLLRNVRPTGQPNYRNPVDRSELVWSTSVGGIFRFELKRARKGEARRFTPAGAFWGDQQALLLNLAHGRQRRQPEFTCAG